MEIKSPLRYPGGKSRAVKTIESLVPDYKEYREPFLWGGSVFFYLKQRKGGKKYWINDINQDLFLFWKFSKEKNSEIVDAITSIKHSWTNGRQLYEYYRENWENLSDFEKAVRFFILNRITFSGTIDSGGYSEESFISRFTLSSIERVEKTKKMLINTQITNFDYEKVVLASGKSVFIFLDPPYYSTRGSKIYGKNGDLHANFDHHRFANVMKECKHKWLISYDDCAEIRELFSFCNIFPWSLQYGMNNYGQEFANKGKELFLSNYEIRK